MTATASTGFHVAADTLPEWSRADQRVAMTGVDWNGYTSLLAVKGDRRSPKMVYLDGSVWLMTPGTAHVKIATRVGLFVHEVVVGLNLRCLPTRSTTFRKEDDDAGFQADQSYYFANTLPRVGPNKIDLNVGPPPDLVVEVVYTHSAGPTIETCRRLGVPEMWVCDERSFRILVLQKDGQYAESSTSASLPFLTATEIESWLRKPFLDDETPWGRELRDWVQNTLVPRVAATRKA